MNIFERLQHISTNPDFLDQLVVKFAISVGVLIGFWFIHQIVLFIIKKQFKKQDSIFTTRKLSVIF